ncbi:MAG: hypothetical protein LHW49_07360 [Candidatus Cloacimonetes bacterium]|nr:hypothetical protein [Candidatus Cloacimonadota bacterium]
MLKRISISIVLLSFLSLSLFAANLSLRVIGNGVDKTISEKEFLEMSKESFKLKKKNEPFVSYSQFTELLKLDNVETVSIKSSEGMSLMMKKRDFAKAGLIIAHERKKTYFRVVVKDDSFRNRWIKNVASIEFK